MSTNSRIYVGTYGKYNAGSIAGAWLDLNDYTDADEFYAACQELHGPGEHEFMFQDWEDIPDGLISESHLSPGVWEYLSLSDEDQEMFQAFIETFGPQSADDTLQDTLQQAQEACAGKADNFQDFAEQFVDDVGMLAGIPESVANYFDYAAFARDLAQDYIRDDSSGYVFNRNW